MESPADRVMPPGTLVKAAGRWDLHQGIVRAGGYAEVGRELGRRMLWPSR